MSLRNARCNDKDTCISIFLSYWVGEHESTHENQNRKTNLRLSLPYLIKILRVFQKIKFRKDHKPVRCAFPLRTSCKEFTIKKSGWICKLEKTFKLKKRYIYNQERTLLFYSSSPRSVCLSMHDISPTKLLNVIVATITAHAIKLFTTNTQSP